jgi:hypothetical protein
MKIPVSTLVLSAFAILTLAAPNAARAKTIKLAQSSTVTNCMMVCNASSASCQSSCVVPGTPPTGAATTTSNATASTACLMSCTTAQLNCQTACARTSPSP